MHTDSDLLIDMSQCGLLPAGIMRDGCSMIGPVWNSGNFLLRDVESHHDQPNMMKIVFRHCCRVRRLLILPASQVLRQKEFYANHRSGEEHGPRVRHGAPALRVPFLFQGRHPAGEALQGLWPVVDRRFCRGQITWPIHQTETNAMKTCGDMTECHVQMHQRHIPENSTEAKKAVGFSLPVYWANYKKQI